MFEQVTQVRCCTDHLLEVVEHDQNVPLADVCGEVTGRAERVRNRFEHERFIPYRREIDPADAVEASAESLCRFECEPRLAGAS